MNLSMLRSGRLELAVCIVGPLLVLAVIAIPGHLYCRHWRQNLADRQACLEQIPAMELQLAAARQALTPFAASSAEGDKAAELTLTAEKAAQDFGFITRSVNVEKPAGAGAESWSDFRIVLNGTGPLNSIIGMLDFLEHPSRRFQVGQVTLKARGFVPQPIYDGIVVLSSRAMNSAAPSGAGPATPVVTAAQGIELTRRLGQLTASIRAWAEEKRSPLSIPKKADDRKAQVKTENPLKASLFTLTGIIRDKKNPLALTDRGVFGVGDKIDGYQVLSIAEDHVLVQGVSGPPETVKLYSDEGHKDEQNPGKRGD